MITGNLNLPKTDGIEIYPGIYLIGSPTARPDLGDNKMTCLANFFGNFVVVELSIRFLPKELNSNKALDADLA
jgi:hypothetical protein